MSTNIQKTPVRKVHYVGSSAVITLDPQIVKELGIDEMTFMSQKVVEGALLMKVNRLQSIEFGEKK
jgi:hypothetical protein